MDSPAPDSPRDAVVPGPRWQFDGQAADCFDDMLARSIPDYHSMRDLVPPRRRVRSRPRGLPRHSHHRLRPAGLVSWTTATHYPRSDRELDRPIDCLNVSDTHFKEQLLLRFESGVTDEGFQVEQSDWLLPSDTPGEFLRHMLGETVLESKNSHGYTIREWQKIGPNHYFECAKYALAARYVLAENLRSLSARALQDPADQPSAGPRVTGTKPAGWDDA